MKLKLLGGVCLCLLGAFFYSTITAIVKAEAHALPPMPIVVFMQSAVALIFFLPVFLKQTHGNLGKALQSKNLPLQLFRTGISLALTYLLFYSVKFIPLVNSMLLTNTSPLIVPFISYLFLGHKINHRMWLPIIIGFAGVTVVLRPDAHFFNIGSLLALGAAVCMASTIIAVRKLSEVDSAETTTFYFFLFSSLIAGAIAIFSWQPMSGIMWELMIVIGILYFIVQYAVTYAIQYISSQLVSTLFYINIVFAALFSWWLWGNLPSAMTWVGVLMIVAGGILCIRAEHQAQQVNLDGGEMKLTHASLH